MTVKDFIERLLAEYEITYGDVFPGTGIGYYLEGLLNEYLKPVSGTLTIQDRFLDQILTRRMAARIIHEYMKNVLGITDTEWGDAGRLKDIYECKVCANAIAQVYSRKIVKEKYRDAFGVNEEFTEDEADEAFENLRTLRM